MRKLIATMNITLDGVSDHTIGIPDEELHQYYTELLESSEQIIYGRTTYQLMESYWPTVVKNPTGKKSTDEFATAIENISKIVFSRTLTNDHPTIASWKNVVLAKNDLKETISALKQQSGKDILVGSPGLIDQCTTLGLMDEFLLCIHPVIAGKGLLLFKNVDTKPVLKLLKTKTFGSGIVLHHYASTGRNL